MRPKFMPADTPDYMAMAWGSCMEWAFSDPEVRAAFEAETGKHYVQPKSGLDKMIDEATGHEQDYFEAFIAWVNTEVWGKIDDQPAPD